MEKIKIVILAAGKGTRMKSKLPKALTLLRGEPMIKHLLHTVEGLTNEKPIVVVGHQADLVKKELANSCEYVLQAEQLGTGHAVLSAKNALGQETETILVIYADQPLVSRETLENLLTVHLAKHPTITLATLTVSDFAEWRTGLEHFGRILRNQNGQAENIVEFRNASEAEKKIKELNLAFYAFDARWLWQNIDKLTRDNTQQEYLLTDLIHLACAQKERIETVSVANPLEALQPNSREELEMLEKLI